MNSIIININGTEYTSIGCYTDNNDGICYYIPSDDVKDWIAFLENEEPIILLWSFSLLQNEGDSIAEKFGACAKKILQIGNDRLNLFVKKYCWQNILDDMFIDFVFGEYSIYGGKTEFPIVKDNNELVKPEEFEYRDHVFIDSLRYIEFIEELNEIRRILIKNIR